jgi:hypothetical protein
MAVSSNAKNLSMVLWGVAVVLLAACAWYFWPTVAVSTISLPEERDAFLSRLRVSDEDLISEGGSLNWLGSIYELGFGRLLCIGASAIEGSNAYEVTVAEVEYGVPWGGTLR